MEILLAKWVAAHLYALIAYILIPTSFICPPEQEYALPEQGFIFSDASTLKAFIIFTWKVTPSFSMSMFWVRRKAQKYVGIQSFPQEKHLGPYFSCLYSCHNWNLSSTEVAAHVWHTFCNCFIENQRDLKLILLPHTEKTLNIEVIKLKKDYTEILKVLFISATLLTYLTDTCTWAVPKLQCNFG